MTRSATDELFHNMRLDKKGSEQHFKVIYDFLSKVKNLRRSGYWVSLQQYIYFFSFLQAYVVATEGFRLASKEGKAAERAKRLSSNLATARKERDDIKAQGKTKSET